MVADSSVLGRGDGIVSQSTLERYQAAVNDALEYIAGNTVRDDRASWTKSERERWKLKRPYCPMCKQAYTGINPLTKEHIHPLFLGGFERADNIDAICKSCNTARNDVMIDVFGTTDIKAIRARMPAMKPAIQSLVIWYIASLNGDHEALADTDAYTDSYLKHRRISNPFNLGANQVKPTSQSAWSRLKNWTKKKFEKRVSESNRIKSSSGLSIDASLEVNQRDRADSISEDTSESGADELTLSEFKSLIKNTIGDELLVMSALGEKIIRYQKSKAWKTTGRKALNEALGFPVAQSYKKSIQIHLADEIDILTSGTVTHYRKKQTSATSVKMPKTAASGEAIESMSMDEFKQHVVDFIGNNSLNEAELGQCVLHLQKAQGWKLTGKSSLNIALGLPKNQTYRESIKNHLSDSVEVSIENDVASFRLTSDALEQYVKRMQDMAPSQSKTRYTIAEFESIVCSLLGNDVVLASDLGVMIRQYQRTNHWAEAGKKAFNIKFGFPESQSYRTSIETHLSNSVEVLGVGILTKFKAKAKKDSFSMDEFKKLVVKLIGQNKLSLSELGYGIIQYQKENEWIQTGKAATNSALGLPAAQTYRKTIQDNFDNEIAMEGEAGVAKLYLTSVGLSLINSDDINTENEATNGPQNSASKSSLNGKKDSTSTSDIGEMMQELIGNNVVEMAVLGQLVIGYQEKKGWKTTGKEAFNQHFGFGKNRPYNKTIANHLSDQYEIFGEYNQYVRIKKFPQVNKFNTGGGSGLRFPVEPRDFAKILVLNQSLSEELDRNERTAIVIKKINLSKTRVNSVFNRMYSQRRTLNLTALETIHIFRENLGSKGVNQQPYSDSEQKIVAEYFASAEFYISTLLGD